MYVIMSDMLRMYECTYVWAERLLEFHQSLRPSALLRHLVNRILAALPSHFWAAHIRLEGDAVLMQWVTLMLIHSCIHIQQAPVFDVKVSFYLLYLRYGTVCGGRKDDQGFDAALPEHMQRIQTSHCIARHGNLTSARLPALFVASGLFQSAAADGGSGFSSRRLSRVGIVRAWPDSNTVDLTYQFSFTGAGAAARHGLRTAQRVLQEWSPDLQQPDLGGAKGQPDRRNGGGHRHQETHSGSVVPKILWLILLVVITILITIIIQGFGGPWGVQGCHLLYPLALLLLLLVHHQSTQVVPPLNNLTYYHEWSRLLWP